MRKNVISKEKYNEIKKILDGFTKEEFREIVKDANKNIDILDESIDNLKRVEVQMLDSVQKEVDRLVKSQKACEWGSVDWKDCEFYIQSLWTVWGLVF